MCNEPKRICFKSYLVSLIIITLQGWWQQVGGRWASNLPLACCRSLCQNFEIPSILLKYFHPVCPCAQMYTVIQPAYWSTKYQVIFCKNIFWLADRSSTSKIWPATTTKPKPTKYDDTTTLYFALLQELEREYTICISIHTFLDTQVHKLSLFATLKYANDLVHHIRNW